MHYEDLTPYQYCLPFKFSNIINIGWLSNDFDFAKCDASSELVEKLYKILTKEGSFESRVNQIRGVHPCNFCGAHKFHEPFIGSCEIWIPSLDVGAYFAAPSLVIHYISEHNYCPPKSFVDAVLQLNLEEKFNGQDLYDALTKMYSSNE